MYSITMLACRRLAISATASCTRPWPGPGSSATVAGGTWNVYGGSSAVTNRSVWACSAHAAVAAAANRMIRFIARLRHSEGPEQRVQNDHADTREYRDQRRDHEDVEVRLAVRQATDGQQRDHGAVVRHAVEATRRHAGDPVHDFRADVRGLRQVQVILAQRRHRDAQAP